MRKFSRRRLLATGAALGVGGTYATLSSGTALADSPTLEKWAQELPVPDVKEPDGQRDGVDVYELTLSEFEQRLHPDLPPTTVWGFDGSYPGPTFRVTSGEPVKVHFDNSELPESHLLDVDDSIGGTRPEDYHGYDGEVPEVRNSVHVHGANSKPADDGQSTAWRSPDGVTGPGYVTDIQTVPNEQPRGTLLYHPHALGITRLNVYAGLVGLYQIESESEADLPLPNGEYDLPLLLQDRTFDDDGSLSYPSEWQSEFAGDTAVVNGAVWPSVEVEPRRYRLRIVNGSNARTYNLSLEREGAGSEDVPTIHQIATGHEFLESAVTIGAGEAMPSLTLTSFERAEVVVDFSEHAGETVTLTNDAEFPYRGENDGSDLEELVQFRVGQGPVPDPVVDLETLELPEPTDFDADDARRTRTHTLGMETDTDATPVVRHVLNGRGMMDEGGTVRPHLGTTEVWELENETGQAHPIHLHQVAFRVLGRGPDGTDDPDPNELGPTDVVRVGPDETVRIVTEFGDYTGEYPWHCHMLEHEDHSMMGMFEVVRGELLEYANETGVVTEAGVDGASADWEAGEIDDGVLADGIDRWRSGEPVVDDEEAETSGDGAESDAGVVSGGLEPVQFTRTVDADPGGDGPATVTLEASVDEPSNVTLFEAFTPAFESVEIVDADGADFTGVRDDDDGGLYATYGERTAVTLVYEVEFDDELVAEYAFDGYSTTAANKGSLRAETLGADGLTDGDAEPIVVNGYEPQPYEGSDRYWDVDGNGDLGTNDVVTFFENLEDDAIQTNPNYFDFDESGNVGVSDVVTLFEQM